jgi:hypothetical protein
LDDQHDVQLPFYSEEGITFVAGNLTFSELMVDLWLTIASRLKGKSEESCRHCRFSGKAQQQRIPIESTFLSTKSEICDEVERPSS